MSQKISRILIAVKPWQNRLPLSAARVAQLARSLHAEVALTSCVRLSALSEAFAWADPGSGVGLEDDMLRESNDELVELDELAQALRGNGVAVTTRVRSDPSTSQGILDEVADWRADLLIAGVRSPHSSVRPRLADVDRQLMRLCPCPLLLTRASHDEPYQSVLAAVDPLHRHAEPTGLDEIIVGIARHLRDAFEAELRIVNIHPNPEEFEVVSSVEVEPGVFYGAENVEAVHRQALIELADACGVADAELILRAGDPAERIAALAAEPATDLVVLGSIKRGRLEAALLGSTAERVVDEGRCDVLLVQAPTQ